MRPDYSHTYATCAYSLKRKDAPWRVTGSCESSLRLTIGGRYELPYNTACLTCPFYHKGVAK